MAESQSSLLYSRIGENKVLTTNITKNTVERKTKRNRKQRKIMRFLVQNTRTDVYDLAV